MDRSYNILVAEDEEYNFTLVKYIFQKEGHRVLWAKNGEEAVDIFKNEAAIDLILMDIKMPLLNGLEATRIIRSINEDIPILAVTAYAFSEDRELCLEAGCNEFIAKPIERKKLLNISYNLIHKA